METADWSRRRFDAAVAAVVSGCARQAGFSAKQVPFQALLIVVLLYR
jgi:hypothetical protein